MRGPGGICQARDEEAQQEDRGCRGEEGGQEAGAETADPRVLLPAVSVPPVAEGVPRRNQESDGHPENCRRQEGSEEQGRG